VLVVSVLLGTVAFVVWVIVTLTRRHTQFLAKRNSELRAVATARGLVVAPSKDDQLFSAEGTTPGGVPLRIAIDRVIRRGPDGAAPDFVMRIVARSIGTPPAIIVRDRRSSETTEVAPDLHELSTRHTAFDEHFRTWAADDEAALTTLASDAREILLELGKARFGKSGRELWVGIDSFRVGSEVALITNIRFPVGFFAEGRIERAVDLVVRLASGAHR
jgi:hypothetical protein